MLPHQKIKENVLRLKKKVTFIMTVDRNGSYTLNIIKEKISFPDKGRINPKLLIIPLFILLNLIRKF